jgi:26S proteasome regulatory subunit T5
MSSAEPPAQPPSGDPSKPGPSKSDQPSNTNDAQSPADADKMDATPEPPAETWSDLPEELLTAAADEIVSRRRLIENDIRVRTIRAKSLEYCDVPVLYIN